MKMDYKMTRRKKRRKICGVERNKKKIGTSGKRKCPKFSNFFVFFLLFPEFSPRIAWWLFFDLKSVHHFGLENWIKREFGSTTVESIFLMQFQLRIKYFHCISNKFHFRFERKAIDATTSGKKHKLIKLTICHHQQLYEQKTKINAENMRLNWYLFYSLNVCSHIHIKAKLWWRNICLIFIAGWAQTKAHKHFQFASVANLQWVVYQTCQHHTHTCAHMISQWLFRLKALTKAYSMTLLFLHWEKESLIVIVSLSFTMCLGFAFR